MECSICGCDCSKCELNSSCSGCLKTKGMPFEGTCILAACCKEKGKDFCTDCNGSCYLKKDLINEFNSLGLKNMEPITDLNALRGDFVNLEYTMSNGDVIKLLDDNKIYLGNQVVKKGSNRCYGLAADKNYLLVCEYGENGCAPEIIIYKKRNI